MASILFAWELGANFGHLTTIKPVAKELRRRGHRVLAALRDVDCAAPFFAGTGVELLPACTCLARPAGPTKTYAQLLSNVGFADASSLSARVAAWRNLIRLVDPDVVVLDHSPTALLAACCCGVRSVILGTGFYVPPNDYPLCDLQQGWTLQQACDCEDRVLDNVNLVLRANALGPLARLAELFHGVDDILLTTFPELDHFGPRHDLSYYGVVVDRARQSPKWPAAGGPRVFAYLRPFPGLETLLASLAHRNLPTLAVVPGVVDSLCHRFAGTSVRLQSTIVDLKAAMSAASLCILHASHGATASALLAACPVLLIPTQSEQALLANRVTQLGAGLKCTDFDTDISKLLWNPSYRAAAADFAETRAGGDGTLRLSDAIEFPGRDRLGVAENRITSRFVFRADNNLPAVLTPAPMVVVAPSDR